MKIAMNQPRRKGLGDDGEAAMTDFYGYAADAPVAVYPTDVNSSVYASAGQAGSSVAPQVTAAAPAASTSIWSSIVGALTSKPLVTAVANKLTFGSATPAMAQYQSTNPNAPYYYAPGTVPGATSYIMGIPSTYFMLAGGAVLLMVMMGKKGRR